MARVGWLGLGAMGLPMARRLIGASHEVTAYDPVPASQEALAAAGGHAVSRPAEVSEGAEAVVVTVATPDQAQAALFGPDGAANALAPGTSVIMMSTIGPAAVRDLAERLEPLNVGLLDAPMSGGVARAE